MDAFEGVFARAGRAMGPGVARPRDLRSSSFSLLVSVRYNQLRKDSLDIGSALLLIG